MLILILINAFRVAVIVVSILTPQKGQLGSLRSSDKAQASTYLSPWHNPCLVPTKSHQLVINTPTQNKETSRKEAIGETFGFENTLLKMLGSLVHIAARITTAFRSFLTGDATVSFICKLHWLISGGRRTTEWVFGTNYENTSCGFST